jgi:hypothetical protein
MILGEFPIFPHGIHQNMLGISPRHGVTVRHAGQELLEAASIPRERNRNFSRPTKKSEATGMRWDFKNQKPAWWRTSHGSWPWVSSPQ